MKYIRPDYYDQFRCIAGACRHTCCRDWDIDIDEDKAEYYRGIDGDIGRRLREAIYEDDDGAHFRCREDGRCPFLNDGGLCDMIIELGEDSMCQICRDHPRFYNELGDRLEVGLGLSCEAAARLILTREQPMTLIDDHEDDLPGDESVDRDLSDAVRMLRDSMLSTAQDRSMPVSERVDGILKAAGTSLPDWDEDERAELLMELECLHEEWHDALARLHAARSQDAYPAEWELPLEQLLCYLLYRHMPLIAEGEPAEAVVRFIAFCWRLVRDLCAASGDRSVDDLIDTARMFSEEIEYSDENPFIIMDVLYEEDME